MWVRVNERFVPSSFYMGAHPVKEVHCSPIATKSPHPNWELGSQHYRFGETPCPSQRDTPLSSYPVAVGKLKQKQPKEERVPLSSQSKDHQEGKAGQQELGAAGRIASTFRRVVNVCCCPSVPFLYSQSPVSQPVDGTTHRWQAFLPQER